MVLLLCMGCTQGTVFHSFKHVDLKGWSKYDTLRFEVPAGQMPASAAVEIELRRNNSYPYRQLWLAVSYRLTSGKWECDTIECTLYDKEGRPLGGTAGSLYQTSHPFKALARPLTGPLEIKVSPAMRDLVIYGICDVGVKLEYSARHQSSAE